MSRHFPDMRSSLKQHWAIVLVVIVSLFLRLNQIERIRVISDVRRDYQAALTMVKGKGMAWMGIPSSVPRFRQGPINVWFDALAFWSLDSSVFSPPVLAAIVTTSAVVIFYFFLLRIKISKIIASVTTLVFATLPQLVTQSRMPFYLFGIPLATLFFLWSCLNLNNQKRSSIFWVVFALLFLFQWEIATLPFFVVLVFVLMQRRIKLKENWKIIAGSIFLGLLPQLVYDITHQCQQICGLAVWSIYRVLAMSGFDGRHGFVLFSSDFWQLLIGGAGLLFGSNIFFCFFLAIIFITFFLVKPKVDFILRILLISCVSLFVGLLIHGEPSEAYFPPFAVLVLALLARCIDYYHVRFKNLLIISLVGIATVNMITILRNIEAIPRIINSYIYESYQENN